MNTETDTMTPREQRNFLFSLLEQDLPSPYTLVEKQTTEADIIDSHFTLCEAAPDLLDALERLVNRVERDQRADNSEYGPSGRDLLNDCKAAIAKAKGDK